jgi:mono/diheme cytochrome c family protein
MKSFLLLSLSACLAHAKPEPAKAGPEIIAEASGKLIAALTEAIAKDGAAAAIGVCSERAPEIATEVGEAHGVTLRRASEKPRNPNNAASDAEKTLLAAFAADLENGKKPEPRVVTNPDGAVVFQAPIIIPAPLCLQCHGDGKNDIAPETLTAIRKRYPDDKATGYKVGDLRGAWSVTFNQEP